MEKQVDRLQVVLFAVLAMMGTIKPALAVRVYFDTTSTGLYLDQNHIWQGGVAPVTGDNVYLYTSTSYDFMVFFRYNGYGSPVPSVPVFDFLEVDNTGGGTMILRSSVTYPSSSLSVNNIYVGTNGSGSIIQNSGAITSNNDIYLGYNSAGSGSYELSGGELTSERLVIGDNGTGSFTQSGGTNFISSDLYLGAYSGSGSYELSGGELISTKEYIGYNTTSSFIQTGGINTVSNSLYLGFSLAGSGSYALSYDAELTSFHEFIGHDGTGSFIQSSGKNTISNSLILGYRSSGSGSYELAGGELTALYEKIGYGGSGSFIQSGGTNTISNGFYLGEDYSGSGSYELSGGELSSIDENIGYSGSGSFIQSGGTNSISEELYLGYNFTGIGSYGLSDGELTSLFEIIGYEGVGSFTQSGGINTIGNVLYLGFNSTGSGSYVLSGGELISSYENIGYSGTGSFTQSGGSNSTNILTIASLESGSGEYNLQGGSLSASVIDNNGTFNQSGGQVATGSTFNNYGDFNYSDGDFDGNLHLFAEGDFFQGSGTSFTAGEGVTNDGDLSISSGRVFNADGSGLINNNTIALNGGTLGGTGPLVNYGRISGYGSIAGSGGLVNYGYLEQSGDLTVSNIGALTNYMFVDLSSDFLNLNGGDFENLGTIEMNNSIINGSATIVNSVGGVVQGDGIINTTFSNAGSLVVDGRTSVSRGFVNRGIVEMAAATSSLNGGEIDNQGTIHGHGQVGNSIINSGQVEAVSGILSLNGAVTNTTSGQLSVGSGSKLYLSQGLAVNMGKVSLMGGVMDNGGHAMSNQGQITGYGVLRSGGLINNSMVLLSGATSTVDGDVTNTSSGSIEVANGHATFNDDVVNDGVFKTTNASVSFAGNFTNNGTYFSDPSTNSYTNLTVTASGHLIGGTGDIFKISGDFFNSSEQNTSWNTREAGLEFITGIDNMHEMTLAGGDLGASSKGFINNFAWGLMDIADNILNLGDGNASNNGTAFYVGGLLGLDIDGNSITNIFGNGYNIYYLAGFEENSYLGGLNYDLLNGGRLIAVDGAVMPTPIPGAVWLFGSGILVMAGFRRKKLHDMNI
jgi:hypothetical protein